MPSHGWEPGKILADRYRIEKKIGSGGMGEVWRAQHIKLASPVAIKVLPTKVGDDPKRSSRFMREAQAAAAIRSTNVVHVLDYGVDDGVAFIAMEYLEGESLDARVDRNGRLTPVEALNVVVQVAKAIGRAHKRGIVHRDLKPANIFIADEDEGEVVKVLDFGIAKLMDDDKKPDATTVTGTVLGTPYYMSPEQSRGHKVVDHRTDLWSLGVIAFECLTGERPVDGASVGDIIFKICSLDMPRPSKIAPVPMGFDEWFRKATRRDADERFQSAREMAMALRELMIEDGALSNPRGSLDSIDPTVDSSKTRSELEMLDTLAAKRQLSQPPGPISDSWDSTGDDLQVSIVDESTKVSNTDDAHEAVTVEHAADDEAPDEADDAIPHDRGAADSNSLRVAALTRSTQPPARSQRGLLVALALGVATLSGAAVLGLSDGGSPDSTSSDASVGAPRPATPGPAENSDPSEPNEATEPSGDPANEDPDPAETPDAATDPEATAPPAYPRTLPIRPAEAKSAPADPEPDPNPDPYETTDAGEPDPDEAQTPDETKPEPAPEPEPPPVAPDPSPQPKDPGKIDFGI